MTETAADGGDDLPNVPDDSHRTADVMLLAFLREYEAVCPVCGYDLKGLTRSICPECGHSLVLTVGVLRPYLGWLLATVAPGMFSGIAAVFVLVPIMGQFMFAGSWEPLIVALDLFGWTSGVFAMLFAFYGRWRNRFLAQPRERQRAWAIIVWLVHVAALGVFILLAVMFV